MSFSYIYNTYQSDYITYKGGADRNGQRNIYSNIGIHIFNIYIYISKNSYCIIVKHTVYSISIVFNIRMLYSNTVL